MRHAPADSAVSASSRESLQAPTRPVLRWHGGKWRLARWIISHFGPHRVYVEPFGGAASVLLRKARSEREIYNDLDSKVVALFRVLRDRDQAAELVRRIALTPYARDEFIAAYEPSDDPIEAVARWLIVSGMGHSTDGGLRPYRTGFRVQPARRTDAPDVAAAWATYPSALAEAAQRLLGVDVENRRAVEVMLDHDAADTLHYVDPPYLLSLRSKSWNQRGGAPTATS